MSRADTAVVIVPPVANSEVGKRETFESILCLILAVRISGHTSGAASSDNKITGPMLEAIYGGSGFLAFMIAALYDCLPDSCRFEPRKKTESLFAGIRLQFFISYIAAFVGSLIWMIETLKATNDQNKHLITFAQIVLGASGFIVSKNGKDLARKARDLFQGQAATTGSMNDPFEHDSTGGVASPIRQTMTIVPVPDVDAVHDENDATAVFREEDLPRGSGSVPVLQGVR